jgi:hypothetical protein
MIPSGSRRVEPVPPGNVVDREDPYPNASPEICVIFGARLCTRPAIDSAASSRGWLPQRPRDGQHARPARRPVSGCRRRAGLVASRNLAFDPLARAAQTHTPRPLGQPHRDSTSLHLEMAIRSPDRLSRETSKTGLRPVGRAAVATFETGLRPARSAPTGCVAISQRARPARRPVSGCRRRAGLLATRNGAHRPVSCAAQTHPLHIVDALRPLGQPRRYPSTLRLEMAFRSADRLSRETSKTGLRPVGQAAVAAFGTGLRPVRSAPTGPVAIGLHARPARRPVSSCCRRAGLLATRTLPALCHTTARFPLDNPPPPARPSLHEQRRGHLGRTQRRPRDTTGFHRKSCFDSCPLSPCDAHLLPRRTTQQAAGVRPCRALRARPGGTAAGRWGGACAGEQGVWMNPGGDERMVSVAHRELLDRKSAYLNASLENFSTSRASPAPQPRPSPREAPTHPLFAGSARIDSAASGRGSLTQKRSEDQHARPARRTVPSCTRRAGLSASGYVAVGHLARASKTHLTHSVGVFLRVAAPPRQFPSLRIEMAFRGAFPLSRETSKTGLRPVGRLLIERLPTGLRPVVSSSNTGNVGRRSILLAIDHHPPFPLDMFALRLRVVGAPTIRDALRQLPALTTRMAHAETPPPSSARHAPFSGFLARASRRHGLLRTNKNSLALRIIGLARPSTLVARLPRSLLSIADEEASRRSARPARAATRFQLLSPRGPLAHLDRSLVSPPSSLEPRFSGWTSRACGATIGARNNGEARMGEQRTWSSRNRAPENALLADGSLLVGDRRRELARPPNIALQPTGGLRPPAAEREGVGRVPVLLSGGRG